MDTKLAVEKIREIVGRSDLEDGDEKLRLVAAVLAEVNRYRAEKGRHKPKKNR